MTVAAIFKSVDHLDTLTEAPTTIIKATSLRECMVLVDDLGLPAVWLDHRIAAQRGSGNIAWLAHDLDSGRVFTVNIFEHADVRVIAQGRR